MKYIFFILTLFVSNFLFGQGLIMPDNGFDVCCIFIPRSELNVYAKPDGISVGKLTLGKPDNNNEIYSAYIKIGDNLNEFAYPNFHMVGYEIMAMTFQGSQSNFVKLQNGYWLNIDELTAKNLKLTSWMSYILENDAEWYANDPGLNLREEPTVNSKIIATLSGDLWGIITTKETKGNWCKVKVTQYRKHPCSGEDNLVIKTFTGWIKLISDEQTPNVWNYAKGC